MRISIKRVKNEQIQRAERNAIFSVPDSIGRNPTQILLFCERRNYFTLAPFISDVPSKVTLWFRDFMVSFFSHGVLQHGMM
jgi:hypothetical protein